MYFFLSKYKYMEQPEVSNIRTYNSVPPKTRPRNMQWLYISALPASPLAEADPLFVCNSARRGTLFFSKAAVEGPAVLDGCVKIRERFAPQ